LLTERWCLVKELLAACLELDPAERPEYLDRACGADRDLRRELESLIVSFDDADDLLDEPEEATLEDAEAGCAIGRRVGAYRLLEAIGESGTARVYLAVRADDGLRRKAALKLLKRGLDFAGIRRRFDAAREAAAGLAHAHIARLLDAGATVDGATFFVSEYVKGHPIDCYCQQLALTLRERLNLFLAVCQTVEYAHRRSVPHGALHARNVLTGADGEPKLVDTGVAGPVRGIPTKAMDMSALGVLLAAVLGGRTAGLEEILCRTAGIRTAEPYGSAAALALDIRLYLDTLRDSGG
jgi:serine/threonine-protein kinase